MRPRFVFVQTHELLRQNPKRPANREPQPMESAEAVDKVLWKFYTNRPIRGITQTQGGGDTNAAREANAATHWAGQP